MGSGCQTPSAYQDALAMCAEMFQYGASIGYNFTLLDIGGGYPGEKGSEELFGKVTFAINQALDKHFHTSQYPSLDIIAEPGGDIESYILLMFDSLKGRCHLLCLVCLCLSYM